MRYSRQKSIWTLLLFNIYFIEERTKWKFLFNRHLTTSESFSSFGYTLIPILMSDIGCVKLVQTCVNLHRPQRFNFCKILRWLGPPFMFIINLIPSRQPTDLLYVLQTFRVEQHRRGPGRDSVWKACSSKRDFRIFLFYLQFTFMFLSGWTENWKYSMLKWIFIALYTTRNSKVWKKYV